jgi:uncharacterized protein YndB with AHSA1/START domain
VNQSVLVPRDLPAVFAVLADPRHLASWLIAADPAASKPTDGAVRGGIDTGGAVSEPLEGYPAAEPAFTLRLGDGDVLVEFIAYEPPSRVAYRLVTAEGSHVLRISCAACSSSSPVTSSGATRVDIHQADPAGLFVDLSGLNRILLDPGVSR